MFPFTIPEELCQLFSNLIVSDVQAEAEAIGSALLDTPPLITCTPTSITVCGEFMSDAEVQKLQEWFNTQVFVWLETAVAAIGTSCPAYLYGYNPTMVVGNAAGQPGCVYSIAFRTCQPEPIPFPKCECNTRRGATPFAVQPFMYPLNSTRKGYVLHCMVLDTVEPYAPESKCGRTTVLNKAEFWANEDLRRAISRIGVQPAGAAKMSFRDPSWGKFGDQTLKASSLNWSLEQAKGAAICFELDRKVPLSQFCNAPQGLATCWANLFDISMSCCPLFGASSIY